MSMRTMRAARKDDLRLQLDFFAFGPESWDCSSAGAEGVRQGRAVVSLPGDAVTAFAGRIDLVQALAAQKPPRLAQ